MSAETETPAPAVGQTWQDNDKRFIGRYLVIVAIEGTHAEVKWQHLKSTRRIRLDRFRPTSTGYRYVKG